MEVRIQTESPAQTARLARLIGSELNPPCLVLLKGDLGAGKTAFAKAFAEGFGSADETSSPSFALANTYESPKGPIHHLDLYRIGDPEELYYMGLEDYLRDGAAVLIEWPEIAGLEDRADLIISINALGPEKREFVFEGSAEAVSILSSFSEKG